MTPDIGSLIQRGAVHRSVYTDPALFEREMEMIFSRSWVYVGHASEIKAPGDYKTTMIGRHPVILSRLADGGIALLVNRCRHRGATVCQRELGNSKYFRCAYHGWTYGNDGALVGFPSPGGYGADIKRSELGLVPVARVAEYRGFIFGCMTAEGPTLEEHLGGTKRLLDAFCDVSPTGEIEVFEGYQKAGYDGNWKYQLENGADPYHVAHLHRSVANPDSLDIYKSCGGWVVDMDGHPVTDHTEFAPMPLDGGLSGGFTLVLFPNLIILRSQIRVVRPIAVDRTEIYTSVVRLQGVDEAINVKRMRDQETEFGAAGSFYVDDMEIFERSQRGLQSEAVDWLVFARGLDRERVHNGYLSSDMNDETQHRGLYRRWAAMMSAAE
jgi:phenylpropionate dioxygenase-like ring-hydroxylating dioxygenase large terminal subunit